MTRPKTPPTQPPTTKPAPTMAAMTTLAPGARVLLAAEAQLIARITAVMIEARGHVTYKVAYWSGTTRQEAWCQASEIEPADDAGRVRIGFH